MGVEELPIAGSPGNSPGVGRTVGGPGVACSSVLRSEVAQGSHMGISAGHSEPMSPGSWGLGPCLAPEHGGMKRACWG